MTIGLDILPIANDNNAPLQPSGNELVCRADAIERPRTPRDNMMILAIALFLGGFAAGRLVR